MIKFRREKKLQRKGGGKPDSAPLMFNPEPQLTVATKHLARFSSLQFSPLGGHGCPEWRQPCPGMSKEGRVRKQPNHNSVRLRDALAPQTNKSKVESPSQGSDLSKSQPPLLLHKANALKNSSTRWFHPGLFLFVLFKFYSAFSLFCVHTPSNTSTVRGRENSFLFLNDAKAPLDIYRFKTTYIDSPTLCPPKQK